MLLSESSKNRVSLHAQETDEIDWDTMHDELIEVGLTKGPAVQHKSILPTVFLQQSLDEFVHLNVLIGSKVADIDRNVSQAG